MLIKATSMLVLVLALAACGQSGSDRAGVPEPGDPAMEEMRDRADDAMRRAEEAMDEADELVDEAEDWADGDVD